MMNRKGYHIIFWYFIFLLVSCTGKSPDPVFIQWQEDPHGCSGVRQEIESSILENREKLMGKSEKHIIRLLGKPERNELFKRNQKFYMYYSEPGPDCENGHADPKMLILRFSAMGICTEVFTQKGFKTD